MPVPFECNERATCGQLLLLLLHLPRGVYLIKTKNIHQRTWRILSVFGRLVAGDFNWNLWSDTKWVVGWLRVWCLSCELSSSPGDWNRLRHLRGFSTSRPEWRYPSKVLPRAARNKESEYYSVSSWKVPRICFLPRLTHFEIMMRQHE